MQHLALASLGVLGNLLLLIFMSLYIALDRHAILAFVMRLVPPSMSTEARLLQTSVASSFGGFIRGQVLLGVVFGDLRGDPNIALGCPTARPPRSAALAPARSRSSARSCRGPRR